VLMENYKSRVIKYWNMLEERGLMARNVENWLNFKWNKSKIPKTT
jgi:hypothetical protein